MDKHEKNEAPHLFIDSKYRKILIAAKRSKQLQKGARPRVSMPNAKMTRVALDSFSARDLNGAESLGDLDELIDRANRRAHDDVLALASDPALREWALRMLFVSRCLERIGDHAVDIGEQTVYLISGEFREFTDASR